MEVDKNGTLYYLHQDHRGTIHKITDANAATLWTGLCDAWGVPAGPRAFGHASPAPKRGNRGLTVARASLTMARAPARAFVARGRAQRPPA